MENEKPPYDETKVFSACVLIGSILVGAVGLIIAIITHSIK
jgi:preprotein translocase subunit Sss1